jgi:hypothetical protein
MPLPAPTTADFQTTFRFLPPVAADERILQAGFSDGLAAMDYLLNHKN